MLNANNKLELHKKLLQMAILVNKASTSNLIMMKDAIEFELERRGY